MVYFSTDTTATTDLGQWVDRIGAEYREMPGLSLTLALAARFWGVTPDFCGAVFTVLTARRQLRETVAGRFVDAGGRRAVRVATA